MLAHAFSFPDRVKINNLFKIEMSADDNLSEIDIEYFVNEAFGIFN